MGDNVTLISPGEEVAKFLKKEITPEDAHSNVRDTEQYSYYVSDSVTSFEELGGIFLETKINGKVKKIDIEEY